MTYERIDEADGIFWPSPAADHPGTSHLFLGGFATPDRLARFHAISHLAPGEDRDDEYPLYLTTGRVMAHYQSGTQTRRVEALREVAPGPVVEIHPTAARLAHVSSGERVVLSTRRGSATFPVKVTRAIRDDTVFVPFHWGGEQSVNRLTRGAGGRVGDVGDRVGDVRDNDARDPVTGTPDFKVCAVRIKAEAPRERRVRQE
jgi:assimilatory nitrate reductase catalytic subunit